MKFPSVAFLCCISLCSILIAVLCESSTDGKCKSLVNSPFNICISAGYNFSFTLPEKLNKPEFEDVLASALKTAIQIWEKCETSTWWWPWSARVRFLSVATAESVCFLASAFVESSWRSVCTLIFVDLASCKSTWKNYSLCVLVFPMKNQATKSASSRQTSGQTTAYQVSTDTFIKCPMPEGRRGC